MASPEKMREYRRKYRETHRDKIRAAGKIHREQNKDKLRHYRNAHKARHRRWKLQTKYGLTLEQMEQMFVAQNGQCAICLKPFEKWSNIHVDHNHETGKVRQLLCSNCNTAIGLFHDNIQTLSNAIDYLNKWNKPAYIGP